MQSKRGFIFLCGMVLLALGCADTEHSAVVSPDVQDTEVLTTETRREDMTEGERNLPVIEHLKAYLRLKARSPNAAYAELEKAAYLSWWGHPRYEEWARLMFRLDSAGKASISERIRLLELEVEMAADRSPSKKYVIYLEGQLGILEAEKKAAVALGQDPDKVFTKYSIEVVED